MSQAYYDEECAVDAEDDGLNGGNEGCGGCSMTIWYIIIGVIAVALIIVLIVCCTKKKKKNKEPVAPKITLLSDDESIKLIQATRSQLDDYKAKRKAGGDRATLKEAAEKHLALIKDTKAKAQQIPEKFPARAAFLKMLDNQEKLADLDEKYMSAKVGDASAEVLQKMAEAEAADHNLRAELSEGLAKAQEERRRSGEAQRAADAQGTIA